MRNLIIILFLVMLSACKSEPSELRHAEKLIEEYPEEALAQLETVELESLSASDRALYGLLMAEVRYKNYLDVIPDSLLDQALERYGNTKRGIRAYFYSAVAQYQSQNYAAAMRKALGAYEQAKKNEDYYWQAKTAELIADIYYDVYNYEQSEEFVKEAIQAYQKAGREANHRCSLVDLAAVYLNEQKDSLAIVLLDSLQMVIQSEENIDTTLLADIEANRFSSQLSEGIATAPNYESKGFGGFLDKSESLRELSQYKEAQHFLNQADSIAITAEEKVRVKYATYLQYMAEKNYTHAALVADTVLTLQSEIAGNILKESVSNAKSDFYKEKSVQEKRRSTNYLIVLVVAILVLLLIIVLIGLLARIRIRLQSTEMEATLRELESLRQSVKEETIQQHELIENLFRERWETINILCNEYFERADSDLARRTIVNNMEAELAKLRTPGNLRKIEEAVNRYMDEIITLLRTECPWLKEEDIQFLTLVFAGLSTRAVCLFTGIKYKYFYLKKSRLTKRISESEAPHRSVFLSKL